ncbi:MAG: T9SS type A sorting domain-containing protein [Bacteroidetes bacterium]|nr:T9SS type A sorting domain-containing protein [Bacteroidota bacterium]
MDSVVTLNDLAVNQTVEILAFLQSNNSYLALVINIEEDPNVTTVSGFINNVTQNSLSVALPSFIITPSTIFLNLSYQPISVSDLVAGQEVTVWGNQVSPSQIEALQIIANTDIVTGIEDNKNRLTIPDNFSLSQNYPNPFNPSTRIRYTLSEVSFVTLKIYNILGKEVATLVNELKPSGTFEVTFNAHRLASGVYFYSLHAGNFVKTKKLILLK